MYQLKDVSKISIINQSELARKVGVNQATLNRIFNKKQNLLNAIQTKIIYFF